MPKVGSKEFTYDKKGMKAAKREASKTGKKMVMTMKMKRTKKK
jgi:hypothetical protein